MSFKYMAHIDKNLLSRLYSLSRIAEEDDPKKEEKILGDLSKILEYFEELSSVSTEGVESLSGGGFLLSVSREDGTSLFAKDPEYQEIRENSVAMFSEKEREYLKIPPVFE